MSATRNALTGEPVAGSGQSLEQEISSLISSHGKEAVAAEIAKQTKPKRGPKPKPDWLVLSPAMWEDANDLLNGRDPFTLRTNYALARKFAKERPGHNVDSTIERLEKKLRADRRWAALSTAWSLTFRDEVPHNIELRILSDLAKCGPNRTDGLLQASEFAVAQYRKRFGEPPAEWSVRKIERELTDSGAPVGVLAQVLMAAVRGQ